MKFVLRLLIVIVVLLALGIGLGPTILSTGWGKSIFVKGVNQFTKFSLQVETLHLSWGKQQQMSKVELLDKSGKVIFRCDSLETDATLWQIVAGHNVGQMKIVAPKMTIEPKISNGSITFVEAGLIPSVQIRQKLPINMSGDLTVEQGEIDFLSPGFDPIQLQNISLALHLPKQGPINVSAHGETAQAQVLGKFDLEGALNDSLEIQAHLANFPTRCIDQSVALFQPRLSGVLLSAIGEALNVDLQAQSSQEILEVSLEASSPNFTAHVQTKSDNDTVSLQSPILATFMVKPDFAAKLFGVPLQNTVALALKIDDFRLPLANRRAFSVQGSLSLSDIQLPEMTIQPAVVLVSTTNAEEGRFNVSLQSSQLSISEMHFAWKENLTLLDPIAFSGMVKGSISKLSIPSQWQQLQLEAEIDWKGTAKISANTLDHVSLDYTVSEFPPFVSTPATLHVDFDPITSFDAFQGKATIDALSLQNVSLQNIRAPFQFNRKDKTGSLKLNGNVGAGSFDVQLSVQKDGIRAKGNLAQVPTSVFGGDFSNLLGKTVTMKFDGSSTSDKQVVSVQGNSDLLNVDLNLQQAGNIISLVKPGTISYTLTQEGYAALYKQSSGTFQLADTALLNLSLSQLRLPATLGPYRIPSITFDFSQIQLQGDLTVDKLSLVEKTSGEVTSVNGLKLHLVQSAPNTPLAFNLSANVDPKGTVAAQGTFDHAAASTALSLNIQQFSTSVLDLIIRDLSLSTILGPTVNATASIQVKNWTGPLKLSINAPNTRASLDGSLKDGILTLNDTIYAQITMTPELSDLILKDINPLSITAIRAQNPLSLEIPASGFAVSLRPFSLSSVTIPNARIELGQIFCKNGGNLNVAMGLLKLSQFSKDKEMKLWFAPIDLHIQRGVVDCERTEILVADTYDICTWGQVDLVKNYVDMVLGLTGSCLKKAFGIKDLPSDYVLQLPMKGPTNNVQIDTSKATAKVTALLLWQQKSLAGDLVGGSAGSFLGGVLDKLGPLPDFDTKAPPAKHPFPWETSREDAPKKKHTSEAEPPKKKKHIRTDEKPLKQLLKILK